MKVDINTAFVFKTISAVISIGTLLWLLAGKFNDSEIRDKELLSYIKVIEVKQNILMEERMSRMERTELYNRMNKILNLPSNEDNYSPNKFSDKSDYFQKQSESKK